LTTQIKVVAYLRGVPSPLRNTDKVEILKNFIEGVKKNKDIGIAFDKMHLVPCDVAIMQGFVHEDSARTPHLNLRRSIVNNRSNKHTIIVDSNLFNYASGRDNKGYLRYSVDGIFPTTGYYFDRIIDKTRWQNILQESNIQLKPWRNKGNHILLCCQRNGGWSMKKLPVPDWIDQTVKKLRQYTDRPILIRPHPGDKKSSQYLKKDKQYRYSKNKCIKDDLYNAWATITYNSSPGVASAIEGIPVFVTDPKPKDSQAYDICNTNLEQIENPQVYDREPWLEKLAMCHYKLSELNNGTAWSYMRTEFL